MLYSVIKQDFQSIGDKGTFFGKVSCTLMIYWFCCYLIFATFSKISLDQIRPTSFLYDRTNKPTGLYSYWNFQFENDTWSRKLATQESKLFTTIANCSRVNCQSKYLCYSGLVCKIVREGTSSLTGNKIKFLNVLQSFSNLEGYILNTLYK